MKTIDQYHKWVEWSEEDGVYIGRCPDLITGIHGDDPIRLYGELCELVDEVIAEFQQQGGRCRPPGFGPCRKSREMHHGWRDAHGYHPERSVLI